MIALSHCRFLPDSSHVLDRLGAERWDAQPAHDIFFPPSDKLALPPAKRCAFCGLRRRLMSNQSNATTVASVASFSQIVPRGTSTQPSSWWGIGHSRRRYLACRSAAEIVFAGILLLLTAPLIAVAALMIKLTSRGPVLYTQVRVGEDGKPYVIYKLRTMYDKCELTSGARWAKPNDRRITSVGRFLRRTHIDELPQLWNVIRGEMSLVGPRPERPEFLPVLQKAIPKYRERLLLRPGLTGLAQLLLPADTDLESARKKLILDRHYVRHVNWWFDLRILLATPLYLLGMPRDLTRQIFGFPDLETARRGTVRETIRVATDVTLDFYM
jgi:lipopolysaccharide/colanic/teichoic acid biosynthesis glycosyltransferase